MAARNGVSAATMVQSGCTGVEDVFSGERNFYIAFDESGRIGKAPEPAILTRGLGSSYEIMRTNIKRWSVGSPIQAPLDSLLELIRAHAVKARDVEKVSVRVSHSGANTVDNREMPDICMQHLVAVMLLDGIVTFESAHDEKRMKDRRILELRKRVDLKGDDELHALLPARHGIVEIVMKDGRRLRHHTRAVRGTADNPMTRAEVDEKCFHLLKPVIGAKRSRQLCDRIWDIEGMQDARALRPLLTA
jgi:2-methylcitrate dehydratase PrpD